MVTANVNNGANAVDILPISTKIYNTMLEKINEKPYDAYVLIMVLSLSWLPLKTYLLFQ